MTGEAISHFMMQTAAAARVGSHLATVEVEQQGDEVYVYGATGDGDVVAVCRYPGEVFDTEDTEACFAIAGAVAAGFEEALHGGR